MKKCNIDFLSNTDINTDIMFDLQSLTLNTDHLTSSWSQQSGCQCSKNVFPRCDIKEQDKTSSASDEPVSLKEEKKSNQALRQHLAASSGTNVNVLTGRKCLQLRISFLNEISF